MPTKFPDEEKGIRKINNYLMIIFQPLLRHFLLTLPHVRQDKSIQITSRFAIPSGHTGPLKRSTSSSCLGPYSRRSLSSDVPLKKRIGLQWRCRVMSRPPFSELQGHLSAYLKARAQPATNNQLLLISMWKANQILSV